MKTRRNSKNNAFFKTEAVGKKQDGSESLLPQLLCPLQLTLPVEIGHFLRWEFTLRRSEELRTPKNSHQVSLVAQTAKWQTHTCVGGSSDPLSRVRSAEETGKEAAGQSRGGRPSAWAAALPSCPQSSSGISRSGRSRGGLPRHPFVCPCPFYFLCPLCKRSPATAPLPPKNLPPRPSCAFLQTLRTVLLHVATPWQVLHARALPSFFSSFLRLPALKSSWPCARC